MQLKCIAAILSWNEYSIYTYLTTLLSGFLISIDTPVSEYADRLISENCACHNTSQYTTTLSSPYKNKKLR